MSKIIDDAKLTTTGGNVIADNQNSISAGPRGPLLMQDYQLIEKLVHQNRERIPERTVHSKGSGACGTIIERQLVRFHNADPRYAKGVSKVLSGNDSAHAERPRIDLKPARRTNQE